MENSSCLRLNRRVDSKECKACKSNILDIETCQAFNLVELKPETVKLKDLKRSVSHEA